MAWLCSDSSSPCSSPSPSSPGASSRPARSASPFSGRPRPRSGRVAIEVDVGPEATTVFVYGELDLVTMAVFAEQLTLALRGNPERLVLDMAATDFMDCGSARLIAMAARSLPEGGRLVIRRPGRGVRRILELTGLGAYCEIDR